MSYLEGMDAWGEMLEHIKGYNLVKHKQGYYHACRDDQLFLVHAVKEFSQDHYRQPEGKWLARYEGEISYLSPKLYELLEGYVHPEMLGQTLDDGTVMSREKSLVLGNLGKSHSKNTNAGSGGRESGARATDVRQERPLFKEGKGDDADDDARNDRNATGERLQNDTTIRTVKKRQPRKIERNLEGITKPKTTRKRKAVRECVEGGSGIKQFNQSKIDPADVAVVGRMNEDKRSQRVGDVCARHGVTLDQMKGLPQVVNTDGLQGVEDFLRIPKEEQVLSYHDRMRAASVSGGWDEIPEGFELCPALEELMEPLNYLKYEMPVCEEDVREVEAHCVQVSFI